MSNRARRVHVILSESNLFRGELNVVRLGDLDFANDQEDASPKNYAVADYFRHPQFSSPELYNDIGMVKLAERVRFDRYKHPACLPFESGQNLASYIAVGWGSTNLGGKSSTKLLKVKLDLIADEVRLNTKFYTCIFLNDTFLYNRYVAELLAKAMTIHADSIRPHKCVWAHRSQWTHVMETRVAPFWFTTRNIRVCTM